MALKPWYTLVTPREDLIEGKPLDASEFGVHLDHVRLGKAPKDYTDSRRFFERTYLTQNLADMAAQTVRRLAGITTETSPIFNLTTQFGGGKTHALTLLYHLAKSGDFARSYAGVDKVLIKAGVENIPKAKTGIFVGTEFSSVTGRGEDGEPLRKTPWGELAFQLGGNEGFEVVRKHDEAFISPAGDDLNKLFDVNTPYLLLFDELLNYVSKHRHYQHLATQFYNFLQTLSEFVRSRKNIVLAVSIPASKLEMTADDLEDHDRFTKMLDRLGKSMFMSAEKESSEIIRRRLFEWSGMPHEASKTISEYLTWLQDQQAQIPSWFNLEKAKEAFEAAYPFHPAVLSLFERKWQSLPQFQQTRGILRLLALWIAKAYHEGYKLNTKDPLIAMGSAPLDDSIFRAAMFEQLGESKLEVAVTTDITGKSDSHSTRLDHEAIDAIKKAKLHKACATVIFFESNGGQVIDKVATVPEIKLAVGEPGLEIGHIDNVLQSLLDACYYLTASGSKYRFSTQENLIKRFSDRQASIKEIEMKEFIENEITAAFPKTGSLEIIVFPEKPNHIPDRPVLSFVVLHPSKILDHQDTKVLLNDFIRNYGQSARIYKSGIIFVIANNEIALKDAARKYLAWQTILEEADELKFEQEQIKQIKINLGRAKQALKEIIWRSYNTLALLNKANELRFIDLGLIHSSQAKNLIELYVNRLVNDGEVTDEISPQNLIRNWPPAFKEWSTKNVKDAFYASPQYPRLLKPDSITRTIAKGVSNGFLAYVGKREGKYDPFYFNQGLDPTDIEISDEVYIITAEEAKKHVEPRKLTRLKITPETIRLEPEKSYQFRITGFDQHQEEIEVKNLLWETDSGEITSDGVVTVHGEGTFKVSAQIGELAAVADVIVAKKSEKSEVVRETAAVPSAKGVLKWTGELPTAKWMVFYNKILLNFAQNPKFKVNVSFQVEDDQEKLTQKVNELKKALKELELDENIEN